MKPVEVKCNVDVDDVAFFERVVVGDAMYHHVVYTF
jgi:hypothetical protein